MKFYDYGDMKNEDNYYKSVQFWAKIYLLVMGTIHNYIWYLIFLRFKFYLIVGNSLLGAFMLEWAWYNTQRIHNVDEERDSLFPSFRRLEAKHWNKWLHYPMAVTILPTRMWLATVVCPGTATLSSIVLHGDSRRPVIGWKKTLIDIHY